MGEPLAAKNEEERTFHPYCCCSAEAFFYFMLWVHCLSSRKRKCKRFVFLPNMANVLYDALSSKDTMRLFLLFRLKVFENRLKSRILHCERSELRLHFEWTKVDQKCQKWSILANFLKTRSLQSNSVTRQVTFNSTKNCEKCQNWKI